MDRINWALFYFEMSKLVDIWKGLENNDVTLRQILRKWISREDGITALCFTIIDKIDNQIEKTYDQASNLLNFNLERDMLQKKMRTYFTKYLSRNFDLFPHVLKGLGDIQS